MELNVMRQQKWTLEDLLKGDEHGLSVMDRVVLKGDWRALDGFKQAGGRLEDHPEFLFMAIISGQHIFADHVINRGPKNMLVLAKQHAYHMKRLEEFNHKVREYYRFVQNRDRYYKRLTKATVPPVDFSLSDFKGHRSVGEFWNLIKAKAVATIRPNHRKPWQDKFLAQKLIESVQKKQVSVFDYISSLKDSFLLAERAALMVEEPYRKKELQAVREVVSHRFSRECGSMGEHAAQIRQNRSRAYLLRNPPSKKLASLDGYIGGLFRNARKSETKECSVPIHIGISGPER